MFLLRLFVFAICFASSLACVSIVFLAFICLGAFFYSPSFGTLFELFILGLLSPFVTGGTFDMLGAAHRDEILPKYVVGLAFIAAFLLAILVIDFPGVEDFPI